MGVQLSGIDKLLKKIDKISTIKTKDIVQEVAKDMEEAIKKGASFSDGAQYIGEVNVRDYGLTCFIDVGLSNDNAPWESWKSLWFQHWGFKDYGLNFKGQFTITNHQNWFDDTVNQYAATKEKELKDQLRKKVKEVLK